MTKMILLAATLLLSLPLMAQTPAYEISKDPKNGETTFRGPLTFADLENEPSFTWLKSGKDAYRPDEKIVTYLREKFMGANYSFVVFLGTWCSDSHDLVPRFKKVLEATAFPADKVAMYGTDREKTTRNGEEKKYGVMLVPTIILYSGEKELGRITETAQKSVEEDIASFLHL